MTLQKFFSENPKAALAFSGGADSAYLLYAGKKYGCDIRPYYVKTQFQPQFELNDARRLARELGVPVTVLEYDILSHPEVVENSPERCFYCKRLLFGLILQAAKADGYLLFMDGTNASDNYNDRPGMRVLTELNVRSPLRECGLTKAEVRMASRKAGLFTWDKPAYACLATRIPTATPLSADTLEKIEKAEGFMASLGISDFRIRVLGKAARIQLPESQFTRALSLRQMLVDGISPYFSEVLLDLKPR